MGRREHLTILYLGVLLHERNKGYGSALLEHVLGKADEAGLPVYAEVTNPAAVGLLDRLDFVERAVKQLDKRIQMHIMVREPKYSGSVSKSLEIRPGRRCSADSSNEI
jgi:ribosomal protein S18 acetylase RimI-like enzyme